MNDLHDINHYPVAIEEKIRLSDTDRQGHVNNVNFSFFYEAGRSDLLHDREQLLDQGCHFVIVTTVINFISEITWPGHVQIGTGVESVGKSSTGFRQALFQNGRCVSTSTSTMVQVNIETRASQPLSPSARTALAAATVEGVVIPVADPA